MQTIGLLKALWLCRKYQKLNMAQRQELQQQRLRKLVDYAKSNSPYYANLYADIPLNYSLTDLPATNKRDLMEHWNDWVTDPSVTLEEINRFMEDKDNIGRKWRKKYMVITTSGSTGNPLVMLCDDTVNVHHLNTADYITFLRIAGTLLFVVFQPFSESFFLLYALTGLTDVLDGWIARKTKTASDFGAILDSIADLLFYAVILFLIIPLLWSTLPSGIWYAVISIAIVRVSAYLVAAMKYRRFASLHTYLNKLTGLAVFFIPFSLVTCYLDVYCWMVCLIALAASVEELAIHIRSWTYCPNIKSIFLIEEGNV